MARKREIPKIRTAHMTFNGNADAFDSFIKSMITDYLKSDEKICTMDRDIFID
ncbi:MAG: hypothetical protein ACI4RK_06430 [Oscillospiraceae bacterium]